MSISIWRHASQVPTMFSIPCIAYIPIFGWLFHMRWWTFWLAVGTIVAYAILAKFGFTFRVLWQRALHILRGSRVFARPWWYRNRFRDLD